MGQDSSDVHVIVPVIISVFITQQQACITNGDNNNKKPTRKGKKGAKVPKKSQNPVKGKIQKLELSDHNFKLVVCPRSKSPVTKMINQPNT